MTRKFKPQRCIVAQAMMAALSFSLFAPAVCHAESEALRGIKPYLVFEDTASPDGRYAVAWGLPAHPDIWASVCEFERQHPAGRELDDEAVQKRAQKVFESADAVAAGVENYLVDVRSGKILHKLDCPRTPGTTSDRKLEPEYWTAAGSRPNRHHLEVVWSRTGDLVLVNHTCRWDCVTFCALLIRDGKVSASLDLNKKLGDAVRPFVAKVFPRGSGYAKSDLDVSFSDVKQLSETKFAAHVDAVLEKNWAAEGSVVNFSVIPLKEGTTLKAVDVRVLRETDLQLR